MTPQSSNIKLQGPTWFASLVLVFILATLAAFSGVGASLPLDGHEVLVARTGEEMMARGQYLVPYINDQPRLKKPPMNYWLAIAAEKVFSGDGKISELEARLPSIIGGVGLAMLAVILGAMLFDRPTGLLAGLLVASCSGYFGYTHSARPEMLYAFFCTLGLIGWIDAARRLGAVGAAEPPTDAAVKRARGMTWLGWVAMGLAMLTKGPQLPAILLLGMIAYLIWTGQRRQIGRVLRPGSGFLIFIAVSMWWYVMIFTNVTDAMAIWTEEAAHRARGNWWTLLDPYYLYRTPGLLLPWVIFFVLALLAPWGQRLRGSHAVKLCWCLLVVSMAVLSLATGRRWYYMLPVLAPMAVLMAASAIDAAEWLVQRRGGRIWLIVVLLGHIAAFVGLAFWSWRIASARIAVPASGAVAIAGIFLLTVVAVIVILRRDATRSFGVLAVVVAAVSCCMSILELRDSLGGDTRIPRRDFALEVGRHVSPEELLIGYTDSWQVESYYMHRSIHSFNKIDDLGRYIQKEGSVWVLTPDRPDKKLTLDETQFHVETVMTFDSPVDSGPPERVALELVTAPRR